MIRLIGTHVAGIQFDDADLGGRLALDAVGDKPPVRRPEQPRRGTRQVDIEPWVVHLDRLAVGFYEAPGSRGAVRRHRDVPWAVVPMAEFAPVEVKDDLPRTPVLALSGAGCNFDRSPEVTRAHDLRAGHREAQDFLIGDGVAIDDVAIDDFSHPVFAVRA